MVSKSIREYLSNEQGENINKGQLGQVAPVQGSTIELSGICRSRGLFIQQTHSLLLCIHPLCQNPLAVNTAQRR
jgi:hypothetical protein